MTLIQAFVGTNYHLKIIGFSNDGYENELKTYLRGKQHQIEFLGKKTFAEIVPYLKSCLCTIVPSEWYDNFPNVVLESYAYKKAVIATDFGSLKYMVDNGSTGLTFKYKDIEDLRNKISYMYTHQVEAKEMGKVAYHQLVVKYSPEVHYEKLMSLFKEVIKK